MYIAKVTASVNSITAPALVINLRAGERVHNVDNGTLVQLLRLNLIKKLPDYRATELK